MGSNEASAVRQPAIRAVAKARSNTYTPRARGVVRWVRVFLAGSAFFFFGVGGGILSWIVLPPVWLAGGSKIERRRRCQRLVSRTFWLFHDYMRVCRLLEFDPRSASQKAWERTRPVIMVANHPTLIDTTAILSCVDGLCCVVTPWFARNPLLLPLLYWCGHIVARGKGLGKGLGVLETARERLRDGHSLLVFPEGTRSPPRGLGRFELGSFHLAIELGTALQPVAISVEPHVLTGSTPWHDLPGRTARYALEPLELIEVDAYTAGRRSALDLSDKVRAQLAGLLQGLLEPASRTQKESIGEQTGE